MDTKPQRTRRKHTSVLLSPEARERLEELAAKSRRSMGNVIEVLVMRADATLLGVDPEGPCHDAV